MQNILSHPKIEQWRSDHPREWWAFQELEPDDNLRERVLASVLNERSEDPAIDDLVRFAEALETFRRAQRMGTVRTPPADGERRSFPVTVTRMVRLQKQNGLCFRVDFQTDEGWAGFFDTTNPDVVERISKLRSRAKPIMLVGEVTRRPYEFLVELDRRVRIV